MRSFLITLIILFTYTNTRAQNSIEVLAGNKEAHYINYYDKNFDSTGNWNFFNLNRFTVNYKNSALNTVSLEAQITYSLNPWLGFSAGGGFYGELFIPNIGLSLSYLNKKENLFIQTYPTVGYFEGQFAPSILGIIGYTPKLSQNLNFSSQLLFSADQNESTQILRVGITFKKTFHFGIGIDMSHTFETKNLNINIGPFLRFNF